MRFQRKKTIRIVLSLHLFNGAPEPTRTVDLLLRRQLLYPAELRAHWHIIYHNLVFFEILFHFIWQFFETIDGFIRIYWGSEAV